MGRLHHLFLEHREQFQCEVSEMRGLEHRGETLNVREVVLQYHFEPFRDRVLFYPRVKVLNQPVAVLNIAKERVLKSNCVKQVEQQGTEPCICELGVARDSI